jgi:hypothetical protein
MTHRSGTSPVVYFDADSVATAPSPLKIALFFSSPTIATGFRAVRPFQTQRQRSRAARAHHPGASLRTRTSPLDLKIPAVTYGR